MKKLIDDYLIKQNSPRKTIVFFDLDDTLLMSSHRVEENKKNGEYKQCDIEQNEKSGKLTKICLDKSNCFYLINAEKTAILFKQLLKNDIQIAFLTASKYEKRKIFKLLEKGYGLKRKTLRDTPYYDRTSCNQDVTKGEAIKKLVKQKDSFVSKHDKIFLVDDFEDNLQSVREKGFYGILANGLHSWPTVSSIYLDVCYQKIIVGNSQVSKKNKHVSHTLDDIMQNKIDDDHEDEISIETHQLVDTSGTSGYKKIKTKSDDIETDPEEDVRVSNCCIIL